MSHTTLCCLNLCSWRLWKVLKNRLHSGQLNWLSCTLKFNSTTNETFFTESKAGIKQVISGLATDPRTYITSVGLYNDENELLAIAKLSQPILKTKSREALIKVKLDF